MRFSYLQNKFLKIKCYIEKRYNGEISLQTALFKKINNNSYINNEILKHVYDFPFISQ